MTHSIAQQLAQVNARIHSAAEAAQRPADSIQLLAVSKTKPVSDIVHAYTAGQRHFGENYVQEGVTKITELAHLTDIVWHYIGPIQSNKSALISTYFDWCHTLEREKIARRLHEQRPSDRAPLNVCIQVNIDAEANKSGVLPDAVLPLAACIAEYSGLRLRGLMAIPKANPTPDAQAASLTRLHAIYCTLRDAFPTVDTLSVGMSADLAPAIAHGSTLVRVGTDIFGARTPSPIS